MSANAKKEIQEVIRKLKTHGIECVQLPNGHWRTDSDPPLTFSFSPSDTNAARAAIRDIRKRLGIDIRTPSRKKGTADDFALQRLRERTLRQMERGATVADLARLAVWQSDEKKIGGWTGTGPAEVGISTMLRGGRLVRQNHDALASALGRLEHAADAHFQIHLDKAADHFGMRRLKAKAPAAPVELEPAPEPEPEAEAENGARIKPLTEKEHRALAQEIRDVRAILDSRPLLERVPALDVLETIRQERPELLDLPGRVEVSVKFGLDEQTLALLAKLLPS